MSRHPTADVLRLSVGLVLAISLLTSNPADVFAQAPGHNHEPRNKSEPFVVGDQVTSLPYFTLRDGMSSQLTLFNSAPAPTTVTLTIYNPEGRPYSPPPVVLDSHSFKIIQLKDVIPDSDFDSGSIELAFRGINMTAVTTQVSIYSVEKRVLVESRHLHMFMSSKLNGIVWLPDAQADGFLAVTNAGANRRAIQLAVGRRKKEIILYGHQTRLIKLKDEMDGGVASPSLISLQHDGLPGDVIAGGFVLDLKKGYSATIPMVDPAIMRSNKLAGAHVRFGQADKREGFPDATRFGAPLLLANLGGTPVTAHVSVDYTLQGTKQETGGTADKVSTVAVKHLTIGPGAVERIELSRELSALGVIPPGGIKEAGVDIAYDGPPGTVIGQLTNVDESGDYSFEVPLKDPSAMDMMMEGGYPWSLDKGRNTTVYVKNTTDKSVRAYAVLAFPDGTMYNPPLIELQPYQTFAIDVQKLKDSKKADVQGHVFPADATHGQFVWRQQTPYSIVGRAETVSLKDGIASSFTCGTGCCNQADEDYYFAPDSYTGAVGTSIAITGLHDTTDCGGYLFRCSDNMGDWTSSNSNVAYNDGYGNAVLVGAGSTEIGTGVSIDWYEWDEEENYCNGGTYYQGRSAQVAAQPAISGPNTVWYFNGQNPSGYATSITLTSNAGSSTTWTVTVGANKINLSTSSGAQTIVTSSGSAFSFSVGDISIKATAGGVDSAPFTLTSRSPYRLVAGAVQTACDSTWGYTTTLQYQIQDNLLSTLPSSIGINEAWTTGIVADYVGTDWRRGDAGGVNVSNSAFADTIDGEDSQHAPLASCTGADTAVQHWGQAWRVGSTISGNGKLVQTNTLQKYIKRASHVAITSPVQ